MIINVHAGHNPAGMPGAGSVGIKDESTCNREICHALIGKLMKQGITVADCTVNDGTSQNDVLAKIVAKCNSHKADLDISIHHNMGRNDYNGDGKTGGVETYYYPGDSTGLKYASKVCQEISKLGYTDRGPKEGGDLYFIRKTAAPAVLIECCFLDDRDDMNLWDADRIAGAIAKAITGKDSNPVPNQPLDGKWYRVQVGAFKSKSNAENLKNELIKKGYQAYIQEY